MKTAEVQLGGEYLAKVSGKQVRIRVESESSHGGWSATNLSTGKIIRIKTGRRLKPAKRPAADKPTKAKMQSTTEAAKPKPLSLLEATAKLLANSGSVLSCPEIIAALAEQGLWTSPGGKTPEATLAAALQREIATKGTASRFRKMLPGRYAFHDESTHS